MAENPSNNMMYNASYVEDEMRDPNAVITDGVSPYNMQDMMSGGVGRYVACELLIGTNNIALRHGVLTQVGPSYFILHNPVANHSTACDLYALKFVTFYPEGEAPAPQDIDRFLRTRVYYSPGQEAVPLSSTVRHTNNMRPYFEPHPEYGVSPFYRTGRHEGYTDDYSRPTPWLTVVTLTIPLSIWLIISATWTLRILTREYTIIRRAPIYVMRLTLKPAPQYP